MTYTSSGNIVLFPIREPKKGRGCNLPSMALDIQEVSGYSKIVNLLARSTGWGNKE